MKKRTFRFELDADYASRLEWLVQASNRRSVKAFIEERMRRDIDDLDIRDRVLSQSEADQWAEIMRGSDDIPF